MLAVLAGSTTAAQEQLVEAVYSVRIQSPTTCQVSARLSVTASGPTRVDHRLLVDPGSRVVEVEVKGADVTAEAPHAVGRGLSLAVIVPEVGRHSYDLRYTVIQNPAWASRCPAWLPAIPASGASQSVRFNVTLPEGARPGDTFPRFTWNDQGQGQVVLANVPALIRVPYHPAGSKVGWTASLGLSWMVDAAAVLLLLMASVGWLVMRVRR